MAWSRRLGMKGLMNTGTMSVLVRVGLLLVPLAAAGGCTMDPALLAEGRSCSDEEPCGPGTVCDPVTLRCVNAAASDARTGDRSGDPGPDLSIYDLSIHDLPPTPDLSGHDFPATPDLPVSDASIPDAQVLDMPLPDLQSPDTQPPITINCFAATMCSFYCGADALCRDTCRSRAAGADEILYDVLQGCIEANCQACSSQDLEGCLLCMESACPQQSADCEMSQSTPPYVCAEWFSCIGGCPPYDESCHQTCYDNMSTNGQMQLQVLYDACPDAGINCDGSMDFFICLLIDLDSSCKSEHQSCMQGYP